ncbi:MAG: hypothetical protein LUG18_01480, partial [Candidatus Azobacteroides sp.]|nr:hypothetical protein [Candidatus Azobacteroides sp.]
INDDTYNIDFKWIHRNINEVINIKRLEPLGIKRPEKLIISQEEKDSIIYVYENQDFSGLENISIGILEEGKSMIIYFISKRNEENYILKYNLKESVISKFSYFDIPEGEKILSEEELTSIIENFRKYGIYMLEIDEEKNIYINPYEINAPPYYMKCKSDTTKQLLEKNDFIYEKYKDNWYINKNYNEFLGR